MKGCRQRRRRVHRTPRRRTWVPVALVTDAMTDRSSEAHAHSLTNIFPRLGETGTTQDVLDLLGRRAA